MTEVQEIKDKLRSFTKDELIDELIGALVRGAEMAERLAAQADAPGGQPQSPLSRDDVAKIIYDAFPFAPYHGCAQKPDWVPGGNSFNQDNARRAADAILALSRPDRESQS